MNKKIVSLISHVTVFVVIEILFVFVILHEFPKVSLFEMIGIVHLSYWMMIVIAGLIREKLKKYRQKFLATYLPVVFHILGHVYVGMMTIDHIHEHQEHHHDIVWMIVSTIALGILIFVGEWLLHRKFHCDTYHAKFHKNCKEK